MMNQKKNILVAILILVFGLSAIGIAEVIRRTGAFTEEERRLTEGEREEIRRAEAKKERLRLAKAMGKCNEFQLDLAQLFTGKDWDLVAERGSAPEYYIEYLEAICG